MVGVTFMRVNAKCAHQVRPPLRSLRTHKDPFQRRPLSMSIYMLILPRVKRKPGALLPLEVDICVAARRLRREFHGFALAKSLADGDDRKRSIAYGTLYRAL